MKQHFFQLLLLSAVLLLFYACGNGGGSKEETTAWNEARKKNTLESLDSFLLHFPETNRKSEIAKLRDGMLWQTALLSKTEFYYRQYLSEFPQGKHAKEAESQLESLPNDAVNLGDLSAKVFVGTIHQGDKDYEVLALKFNKIEDLGDKITFSAAVHLSSDIRKQLSGSIIKPTYSISFDEDTADDFLLNLSNGRVYVKNGALLIESTDPKQYWRLK